MKFEEINKQLLELDVFNSMVDYALVEDGYFYNEKLYNIKDLQSKDLVFENGQTLKELLKIWIPKAYSYFDWEYLESIGDYVEDEDLAWAKYHKAGIKWLGTLNKIDYRWF